jgi:hypothetical protein
MKEGVLNGSIPSAVSNTGASLHAVNPNDSTIPTGIKSRAIFCGAFGDHVAATTINKLHHKSCDPTHDAHIVPQVLNSLVSTSKFVNANYFAFYDKQEVNYYNTGAKIVISKDIVLKGWRCPTTGL